MCSLYRRVYSIRELLSPSTQKSLQSRDNCPWQGSCCPSKCTDTHSMVLASWSSWILFSVFSIHSLYFSPHCLFSCQSFHNMHVIPYFTVILHKLIRQGNNIYCWSLFIWQWNNIHCCQTPPLLFENEICYIYC